MADDPAAPTASEPAPENLEARLWAAISHWRDAHVTGGPIARVTECWNHLQGALEHLTSSILKEL
jgi:hypothetical protein